MGYAARINHRKPSRLRRMVNGMVAWLAGVGLTPADTVRLEVAGRRTGRPRAFAVTMATLGGNNYLVSLAGESDWVRNLRAAGGKAVVRHKRRFEVTTQELLVDQRAPILEAWLSKRALSKSATAAARDYFGVDAHSSFGGVSGPRIRPKTWAPCRCFTAAGVRPVSESLSIGRGRR